jgi:glycine/D-amino acid oxidase-like deaminating enzyme
MHLLQLAVDRGVNLQTNTPVGEVSTAPDPTTGRWTVITQSRGSIRAKQIVFATNAYTAALAPQYQGKIVPVRGICSRIVTPADRPPAPYLPNTYSLRWSPALYDYLVPRPDGSIIVGGARRDYLSDPTNWYNVFDDSRLIEPAKHYFDGYMQRHFHGWENSGAYTDRVWTGSSFALPPRKQLPFFLRYLKRRKLIILSCFIKVMGYSSDYLPHVGHVPGKPGQLIIAGFSGHGMPQIFLAAKGIARMIREGILFEETGVPRLYRTSQERLDSQEEKILSTAGISSERAGLPVRPAL